MENHLPFQKKFYMTDVAPEFEGSQSIGQFPVRIEGDSTGTKIGNVGDRLKVDSISNYDMNLPNLDAFSRQRVSNPKNLFDCSFFYNLNPSVLDTSVANSATVVHDNNKKCAVLSTAAVSNSSAVLQTFASFKYHAARSNFVVLSGNLKGATSGVIKRIGQFNESNGYFFQLDSTGIACVIRSKISGSVVDNKIYSTSWNILNPALDYTKQQIFYIDYQWLGSGRVRFGHVYNGQIKYVHAFDHANIIETLYSQTATLPLRYEISGNAVSTMEIACMCVATEGQDAPDGMLRAVSNGQTGRAIAGTTANFPLISLRKQATYAMIPIDIVFAHVFIGSADDVLIKIVRNPTLTGASWVSASTGFSEYDISAASYTGGVTIFESYLRGASTAQSEIKIDSVFASALNARLGQYLNGNSEIATLSITNITSSSTVHGGWIYKEII